MEGIRSCSTTAGDALGRRNQSGSQGHMVVTEVEISPGRRVPFSAGTPSACVKLPERQT